MVASTVGLAEAQSQVEAIRLLVSQKCSELGIIVNVTLGWWAAATLLTATIVFGTFKLPLTEISVRLRRRFFWCVFAFYASSSAYSYFAFCATAQIKADTAVLLASLHVPPQLILLSEFDWAELGIINSGFDFVLLIGLWLMLRSHFLRTA